MSRQLTSAPYLRRGFSSRPFAFFAVKKSVTSPAGTFTYSYVPNSNLRSGVTGPRVAATYAYEPDRDLLVEVRNQVGATTVSRYAYTYDALGRRQNRREGG